MSATGIGAPVRRKEDQRFITGKGQYTDDINRPGQTYAVFVRSPHAHANIRRHRHRRGPEDARLPRRLHRRGHRQGQGRRPVLRLDDHLQGRLADEGGHPSGAGAGQGALRRRPRGARGRPRRLAQAKDAAEAVSVDYEVLPAVADVATAQNPGQPQVQADAPEQHRLPVAPGRQGGGGGRVRQRPARDQDRPRQQPPDPQRHRAARGDRRVRLRPGQLHAPHHQPEPARHPARARGLHRHRARAQAARDRPGCRRRLRLQDLPLRRGDVPASGPRRRWAGPSNGPPSAANPSSPTRTAATTSRPPSWRSTADGKILALRAKTKANLGAYLSTFASSVPTYLYAPLLSGQYDIPAIYCEVDGVYTNTAPVDAYRGAGRPEATFVVERLVEVAARQTGRDPAEFRRQNFITSFPHQTPVIMAYDAGDYGACLNKALELADYRGPRRPQGGERAEGHASAASASRPTSRPAASRRARPSARSAPASACGNPPRSASTPRARSRC